MIIVMQQNATAAHIDGVISEIRKAGLQEHVSRGAELTIIGAIGDENKLDLAHFEILPGVERAHRVAKQYKIVARATHPQGSVIRVRGIPIGGEQIQVIGGPCSVETQAQMDESAAAVAAAGCRMMRGGASSHAPARTHFRAWGWKDWSSFSVRRGNTICPSLPS